MRQNPLCGNVHSCWCWARWYERGHFVQVLDVKIEGCMHTYMHTHMHTLCIPVYDFLYFPMLLLCIRMYIQRMHMHYVCIPVCITPLIHGVSIFLIPVLHPVCMHRWCVHTHMHTDMRRCMHRWCIQMHTFIHTRVWNPVFSGILQVFIGITYGNTRYGIPI